MTLAERAAPQKISILINPVAGNTEGALLAKHLRSSQEIKNLGAEIVELNLAEFNKQVLAARASDLILIGGGDGTTSKVIEGLENYSGTIGLLPLGTANDLARELGIGNITASHAVDAVFKILALSTKTLDIWALSWIDGESRSQRHTFMNYCSWGFDAAVLRDVDCWRKGDLSQLLRIRPVTRGAYLAFGLGRLFEGRKVQVTVRGPAGERASFEVSSLLVSNIRSYMGAGQSNSSGEIGDAKCELIPFISPFHLAAMVLPGKRRPASLSLTSGSLHFTNPPEFCQIDGEHLSIEAVQDFELSHAFSIPVKARQ